MMELNDLTEGRRIILGSTEFVVESVQGWGIRISYSDSMCLGWDEIERSIKSGLLKGVE